MMRSATAYAAAAAAGGIALASAVMAWDRLQTSATSDTPNLASEAGLGLAVPLLVVAVAVGLSWLARRLIQLRPPAPPLSGQSLASCDNLSAAIPVNSLQAPEWRDISARQRQHRLQSGADGAGTAADSASHRPEPAIRG
jgi:hypothetical protein